MKIYVVGTVFTKTANIEFDLWCYNTMESVLEYAYVPLSVEYAVIYRVFTNNSQREAAGIQLTDLWKQMKPARDKEQSLSADRRDGEDKQTVVV